MFLNMCHLYNEVWQPIFDYVLQLIDLKNARI